MNRFLGFIYSFETQRGVAIFKSDAIPFLCNSGTISCREKKFGIQILVINLINATVKGNDFLVCNQRLSEMIIVSFLFFNGPSFLRRIYLQLFFFGYFLQISYLEESLCICALDGHWKTSDARCGPKCSAYAIRVISIWKQEVKNKLAPITLDHNFVCIWKITMKQKMDV